jgi:hypothetical protein
MPDNCVLLYTPTNYNLYNQKDSLVNYIDRSVQSYQSPTLESVQSYHTLQTTPEPSQPTLMPVAPKGPPISLPVCKQCLGAYVVPSGDTDDGYCSFECWQAVNCKEPPTIEINRIIL